MVGEPIGGMESNCAVAGGDRSVPFTPTGQESADLAESLCRLASSSARCTQKKSIGYADAPRDPGKLLQSVRVARSQHGTTTLPPSYPGTPAPTVLVTCTNPCTNPQAMVAATEAVSIFKELRDPQVAVAYLRLGMVHHNEYRSRDDFVWGADTGPAHGPIGNRCLNAYKRSVEAFEAHHLEGTHADYPEALTCCGAQVGRWIGVHCVRTPRCHGSVAVPRAWGSACLWRG